MTLKPQTHLEILLDQYYSNLEASSMLQTGTFLQRIKYNRSALNSHQLETERAMCGSQCPCSTCWTLTTDVSRDQRCRSYERVRRGEQRRGQLPAYAEYKLIVGDDDGAAYSDDDDDDSEGRWKLDEICFCVANPFTHEQEPHSALAEEQIHDLLINSATELTLHDAARMFTLASACSEHEAVDVAEFNLVEIRKQAEARFVQYRTEKEQKRRNVDSEDDEDDVYQNDSDDETGLTDSDDDELDEMEQDLCEAVSEELTVDSEEMIVEPVPARVMAQV